MSWYCWHDDGRFTIVKARNDRQAIDRAMDFWNEYDINKIAVERYPNDVVAD